MCCFCHSINKRRLLFHPSTMAFVSMLPVTRGAHAAPPLPSEIVGIRIPDSSLTRDANIVVHGAAPSVLYNHSLRTFVLGMLYAQQHPEPIDEEAAFVASILHDIGLTSTFSGDDLRTFEENGAEYAKKFLGDRRISSDRVEKVAKAIELHAGAARGMGPDIEFVMNGAWRDLVGPSVKEVSTEQLAAIEAAVPRLQFKIAFPAILKEHGTHNKNLTWTENFGREPPLSFRQSRWSE